jgi:hypothetical protein
LTSGPVYCERAVAALGGKDIGGGEMMMDQHIKTASIIQIALGIPGVLAGLFIFFVVSGGGLLSGDPTAIAITGIVAWVVGGLLVITHIPGIIGGIFMLQGHRWARYVLIVVAALELLDMPIGTAAGIYTLWALLRDPRPQATTAPSVILPPV